VYGELGTAATGNVPGSRDSAATWTDASGNFWLFGGQGFDVNGDEGDLNDVWEFSPVTNEWTWMGGSNSVGCGMVTCGQPGVYGVLGSAAAGNIPGGRYGATAWSDAEGNLWLFGGMGHDKSGVFGSLNDVWKFSPAKNEWTWIGGVDLLTCKENSADSANDCGAAEVFAAEGVAAGNLPPGAVASSGWTDASGHFWLYGGWGYGEISNTSGTVYGDVISNDSLWEFNPTTDEWAWMGSPTGCEWGTYGTLGTPAAGNIPGMRNNATTWTGSNGNLWLFGGQGVGSSCPTTTLNDVWEFNPTTYKWAWMGGSGKGNQSGVASSLGAAAAGNIPGSRSSAASWTDSEGNFWLFGGQGFDTAGTQGELNDLWELNPATNNWEWVGGSSTAPKNGEKWPGQTGVYGVLKTPASGNIPGGRSGASSWTDSYGNLWLFGGFGYDGKGNSGFLNDMWEYKPLNAATPADVPTFSVAAGTYTSAQSVGILDGTTGAILYYTTDGTTPTAGSAKYGGAIPVSASMTIKAIATAPGLVDSPVGSATYTINLPVVAAATFKPAAGTYGEAQAVVLASTTSGAILYFTTDGSAPSTGSTRYSGAIAVTGTETIKAIATLAGHANGSSSAAYKLAGSPQVLTQFATNISTPQAVLNATVNGLGLSGNVRFVWGASSSALSTSTAQAALPASAAAEKVSATLTGLKSKTTYYFQPVAATSGGTSYGAVQSFTTN
jgi:N-acetylneuraminic acid mutarotase